MISSIAQLVHGALTFLQGMGYPGIAAVVGLESAGLPLPGETVLFAASYLAATGHLSLPLVIGSAALGAAVGDSTGYLVGRRGGRRFLERRGRWIEITPGKLAKADHYFARHGAKMVFFGRFVALLRVLAGPLAGASKMPYRRFLAANVAGAVTWATAIGTLAFLFGKPVAAFLSYVGIWALIAIVVLLLVRFVFRRWQRARRRSALVVAAAPQCTPGSTTKQVAGDGASDEYSCDSRQWKGEPRGCPRVWSPGPKPFYATPVTPRGPGSS